MTWNGQKNCVLIEEDNHIIGVIFTITSTKLDIRLVTWSINDNIKFLENIKQGFKRAISLNKYRCEITTEPKNNNLDYLIDQTFKNINRLFILSFKNGYDDPTRSSFDRYYIPLIEIKDFIVLIDNKRLNDRAVKNTRSVWKVFWNVKKWWLQEIY